MISSPWKSTVLRQHVLSKIVSELALAKAMGGLVAESSAVILVTPGADKVDAFVLPITAEEYGERKLNDSGAVFIDGRSFMRREQRSDVGFVIANQTQADFAVRLGELVYLWQNKADEGIREDFLRVGDLGALCYIAWLSGLITSKMGVDLDVSREIQIITGLFYIHQFHSADNILNQRGKEKAMKLLSRWTRASFQLVESIVNETEYMGSISDYVDTLKRHFSANTRLAQVNVGFITMSLGRSWFGFGAQEIAGCAIEYPPAFLCLIEAAANAKVWRKTHLGQLVQRLGVGKAIDEFSRSMEILAGQARGKDGAPQRRVSLEAYQANTVSDEQIAEAEKTLKVTFAPDYVDFLRTYGFGSWGSHEICGLGKEGHLNVVSETQDFQKYLKPGRYVIENVGVDSQMVVADEKGKLYIATPTAEKALNITFGQYLKDVIAGKR